MFDGVHLGHQSVITAAIRSAEHTGGLSGVLTFFPHPTRILAPEHATRLLQPPRLRTLALRAVGVDVVVWTKFTRAFAAIPAREFLPHLKKAFPDLRGVYVGENFRFGAGRSGDVAQLVRSARQLKVDTISIERMKHNGHPVSSSRIRQLLQAGQINEANTLLGSPYFCQGMVQPGRQLARQLGFPTLNLPWAPELLPAFGVYAVQVSSLRHGQRSPALPAVANYGIRPTVMNSAPPLLEIHLLPDHTSWTTGDRLHVEWLHFLRPERKFASLEELQSQIARDKESARACFPGN